MINKIRNVLGSIAFYVITAIVTLAGLIGGIIVGAIADCAISGNVIVDSNNEDDE